MLNYLKTLEQHAKEALKPAIDGQLSPAERIALYKQFLKIEEQRILQHHRSGVGGIEIARDRAALIDTPNDVDLICLRGTVAVMRDDLPQAEALFRESIQIRPKEDRFLMNLAEILYRQGKYPEAAPMYARISKRHPVRPLAQYKQILCFLLADDRATAANLTEALDLTPGDPAFLYAHAALAYYDGDTAAGRYFAESARRLYQAPSDVFRLPLIEQGWVTDS